MNTRTLRKIIFIALCGLFTQLSTAHVGFGVGFGFGGPRYYASYEGPWYNRWGWDGPGYWGHRRYYDDGAAVAASGLVGFAAGAAIASAAQPKDPALARQEYEDRKMLEEQREKDRQLKREQKERDRELKRQEAEEKRQAKEEELEKKRHDREERKRKRAEDEQMRRDERESKHTKTAQNTEESDQ